MEWIVEAPSYGGIIQPLAKFGTVSMYNACFVRVFAVGGSNTCEPIAAGSQPTRVTLTQYIFNDWQIDAEPFNFTGNSAASSFDVIYAQPLRDGGGG